MNAELPSSGSVGRATLLAWHLAQAESHVALGQRHIARQKEILSDLERDGHDNAAQTARELLATIELSQRAHVTDFALSS